MVDQDEIIRIVAKEYGLLLDKNDPILAFLAVHDSLLETNLRELEAKMRHITDQYQERAKVLAESIVGDAVRNIAAEGRKIQDGARSLRQQEQADMRRLAGVIKFAASVISAALILAAITAAFS